MIGGTPLVFTIDVPGKERKDRFNIQELLEEARVYHHSCEGGRTNLRRGKFPHRSRWHLKCSRCNIKRALFIFDKELIDICKTAIDGEERKLTNDIRVRRRDTTKT
jgi:hypothetical protein